MDRVVRQQRKSLNTCFGNVNSSITLLQKINLSAKGWDRRGKQPIHPKSKPNMQRPNKQPVQETQHLQSRVFRHDTNSHKENAKSERSWVQTVDYKQIWCPSRIWNCISVIKMCKTPPKLTELPPIFLHPQNKASSAPENRTVKQSQASVWKELIYKLEKALKI